MTPSVENNTGSLRGAALWAGLIGASLIVAMLVGVWMRWMLAGAVPVSVPWNHVRHAHSHLGYFGVLFPLAWLGWRSAGARVPGRAVIAAYSVANVAAFVGFWRRGYGPLAIVASTCIAGFWLWSAFALRDRPSRVRDPLGMVPFGIVLSLACVPPIAINLRSNPTLAHGFVSTFLAGLLFVVIVPSAFAARRISPGPWPAFLLVAVLAALCLGVAPHPVTRAGLLSYAAMIVAPCFSKRLELHARLPWALVGLGLGALALGVLPNTRSVALGAVHFLILGPVLATLAPVWLTRPPPAWAWWLGHLAWGTMSAALVLQAFVTSSWTWFAAAVGGTATLVWWSSSLVREARHRHARPGDGVQ